MSKIHEALRKLRGERKNSPSTLRDESILPSSSVSSLRLDDAVAGLSPEVWTPRHPELLLLGNGRQPSYLEPFHRLRIHLHMVAQTQVLKSVLLTSAIPGEGKTFITANLGIILAKKKGRKVLMIDADLRHGSLTHVLGARRSPGLVEFLKGSVGLDEVLQRGGEGELYLISSGRTTSQAAELLHGARLRSAMGQLRPIFDWIIIDSPAALPVSDASELATVADGVALVVRAAVTRRDLVLKVKDMFQDRMLGVVLNGVRRNDSYSAYDYPGYLDLRSGE